MNKRNSDMVRDLESLGYVYDHTNSKGFSFYLHEDTGSEVKVPSGVTEQSARSVMRIARHQIGLPLKDNKRNAAQIRDRNTAEHAKAAAELARLRDKLANTDASHLRDVEDAYMKAERKFRYWDRLMREPVSVA